MRIYVFPSVSTGRHMCAVCLQRAPSELFFPDTWSYCVHSHTHTRAYTHTLSQNIQTGMRVHVHRKVSAQHGAHVARSRHLRIQIAGCFATVRTRTAQLICECVAKIRVDIDAAHCCCSLDGRLPDRPDDRRVITYYARCKRPVARLCDA